VKPLNLVHVKRITQKEIGYCGPATVSMLLSVLHLSVSQDQIMEKIGIKEEKRVNGTRIDQLGQAVNELASGYTLLAKYNSTIQDLEAVLSGLNLPVGIEWQGSFKQPDGSVYDEGHYSVVFGADSLASRLFIIDPDDRSVFADGSLSLDELRKRWWDINRIPLYNNGHKGFQDIANQGLIFLVVPDLRVLQLKQLGYQVANIALMKANQVSLEKDSIRTEANTNG
jgi:hypothetical protein